jgi:UDP-glucose 4-epimerase
MKKNVFLTGGAGFIGSHVAEALVRTGSQVTVYDNFSSGRREWIERLIGQPGFRLVEGDIRDSVLMTDSMAGHDLVWHLAANTDIPAGVEDTTLDLENCVIGTVTVLNAMRATGVQDILFASTGAVYGDIGAVPMPETTGPLLPNSLYAAGKLSCEAFISAYCYLFGRRAWIFRFGNVVGARMGHGVIQDFVRKLRERTDELEVLGDGHQEKNYFLVEECIDGMMFAYENISLDADTPCTIINLGTDTTSRVTEIAKIVAAEMGLPGCRLRFTGGRRGWPGDQPQVRLRVDRMKELGWQARHSSDQAVAAAAQRLIATNSVTTNSVT